MTFGDVPISRYPLSWPAGWKRTPARERRRAQFSRVEKAYNTQLGRTVNTGTRALSVADALRRLQGELDRLGAVDAQLSTNVPMRLDGLPRSGQSEPADPGAAVYFLLKGKPLVLACDRWTRVADNIAAIAQHIDALRRIDRYGVGSLEQAFAGYTALPQHAGVEAWWEVLGCAPTVTVEEVEARHRALARAAHPDVGGSHAAMARLNRARDEARRALGSPP
jgi:hypothetical protein